MHPRLFEIPIIHWPVGTYGPMLVIGFLAAIMLIRRLSRSMGTDPQHIINAALYSLIGGVIGARLFYFIHYYDKVQMPDRILVLQYFIKLKFVGDNYTLGFRIIQDKLY